MRDVRMNASKWMLVAAAMLLSACANPFADDAPSFNDILSAGWLNDDEPSPVTPLYCYEPIGAKDYYAKPLAGKGRRLQGFEGPAPRLRADN